MADVAGGSHLFSHRFQEPPAGRAAMGVVVFVISSRRAVDRHEGLAIQSAGGNETILVGACPGVSRMVLKPPSHY